MCQMAVVKECYPRQIHTGELWWDFNAHRAVETISRNWDQHNESQQNIDQEYDLENICGERVIHKAGAFGKQNLAMSFKGR